MENLKIVSLNVRGLRNTIKRKKLFKLFKENKHDVVCLQESYITKNVYEQWKKEWGGDMIYCEGTNHGRGQLILIRKQFPYEWEVETIHERILSVKIKTDNKHIGIFNIYAPCSLKETKEFFNYVKNTVNNCEFDMKIVCGDFNAVLSNDLDIISGEKHSASLVKSFNDLADECELNDVWRIFNAENKEYTWSRKCCNNFIARRLDYILLNDNAMSEALETNIFSVPSSDHRGIYVNLKVSNVKRGPGYFKFNNTLLKDKIFVQKMNNIIDEFLIQNLEVNFEQKWELLKLKMKEEAFQYSRNLAVKKKNNYIDLYGKLNDCEAILATDPDNEVLQRRRETLKLQIDVFEQERLKSAQIRSRVRWVEEGEKNTKFFLNLEKSRANLKMFPNIELDNGDVVVDQFEILKTQKDFYENLYSKCVNENLLDENIENFLDGCEVPQLTEDEMKICEGSITVNEASSALKEMKNGSAPGSDGLTTEFLKFFWPKIKDVVVQSFNESFVKGSLSYTQTSAVITLLHKGKDLPKNKLSNWRPISLTNTDYKILAKCLANRLSNVINTLVSEDQVGYIKGRHVSTTLRTIDDIIEYYRLKEKPGVLLALDFQKAFDSISKNYMLSAFKKFGFGNEFVQWIKVLFTDTKSCMIYNGWLSEDFAVKCGIRQGCPFSPLAFVMGVELLAIRLRQSAEVKGMDVDVGKLLKVLLYADDITVFLKDREDVSFVLKIIDEFSVISGLHLNKQKSEAMGIGLNRHEKFGFGLKWVDNIKILGVYFCNTKSASEIDLNWTLKITQIKQLILNWEKRNLGLLGKICIIKSFLLSQFIYVMQAICIPETVLKEVNTILYRFLWRKANCNRKAFEKVKRVVVNSDVDKGGIKMIDVEVMQESFLCQWLSKLAMADTLKKWTWIPSEIFSAFGRDFACLNTTVGPSKFKGLNCITSVFWKAVLRTWVKYNKHSHNTPCKMTCIWNNSNIMYQHNVIYFKHWAKGGFTYVNDFMQDNVLLTFPAIQAILGPSPNLYLEYIVVYSAVSGYLKRNPGYETETEGISQQLLFNGEHLILAKSFRKHIVDLRYSFPCAVQFWKNKFDIDIDMLHWNNAYRATSESRLRELQWKIIHNIYPTNILLKKMDLANSDRCSFCLTETDFIEHFFYECLKIKRIWSYVEQLFYARHGLKICLNAQSVLLGIIDGKTQGLNITQLKCINFFILVAKMCVSKYRYGTPIDIIVMFDIELQLRKFI